MTRAPLEYRLLYLWALAAGIALWIPAYGVRISVFPFQPMDVVVFAGLPLILVFLRALSGPAVRVLLPLLLSILLSWIAVGGQVLVLGWTLGFAVPFVALMALVLQIPQARKRFLRGFRAGAVLSLLFFMVQIVGGAEFLDWRSNTAFSLPPHYGRGFALFPEVSTFAVHAGIASGMALVTLLHVGSPARKRRRAVVMLVLAGTALLFSRSSSVLVLIPVLTVTALVMTTRPTANTLLLGLVLATVMGVFLTYFLQGFYVDRLESNAAGRSGAMRLASMIGGLSPLTSGELFGVGIGENSLVSQRAYDAARSFGLRFGALPDGVNSQIIGRIFEEGWPALLQTGFAAFLLAGSRRAWRNTPETGALFVLALGSFLSAAMISGYRGIYTNWFWLAAAAAWVPAPRYAWQGFARRGGFVRS
jgi:hypothetical protein